MKKRHLLLSALLCAALTTTAQTATISWGYCNQNANPENSFGTATTAKGAIYIPAEIAKMYQGAPLRSSVTKIFTFVEPQPKP